MARYIVRAHILVEAPDDDTAVAKINETFDRSLQLRILSRAEWNFTSPLRVLQKVHKRDDLRLVYENAVSNEVLTPR